MPAIKRAKKKLQGFLNAHSRPSQGVSRTPQTISFTRLLIGCISRDGLSGSGTESQLNP